MIVESKLDFVICAILYYSTGKMIMWNPCIAMKYTPKEGMDAGRTFYPHMFKMMQTDEHQRIVDKFYYYLTEDKNATEDSKYYTVHKMDDVVTEVEKGSSLRMIAPGADLIWVNAEDLKKQNPILFKKEPTAEENRVALEAWENKLAEYRNRYGAPDPESGDQLWNLHWELFRDVMNDLVNIELLYDAIGIRPTADNQRAFAIALMINGNTLIRRAAEEMLAYGYVSGEEPRQTRCLERAKTRTNFVNTYAVGSPYQFMLDHFDEWKQYRSMYKPLTAEQVYDKYGPERMKEMWGAFCKDEEYFVDLYTYIDFEVDPTWVSDFIGGTNRVKEFFFDLLWNQVLNNLNDDMMGLDGEQIIRMK